MFVNFQFGGIGNSTLIKNTFGGSLYLIEFPLLFRTAVEANISELCFIMHPAQPSEARLGGVHFIFRHVQICTRLLQGELFKVTTYTAHISSNGSHFMTARDLVY